MLIALEKLHGTMAALLGVAVVLGVSFVGRPINEGLFIFDFERALQYVDFDVIFLVMGMMIVIGIIEGTGIFQWLAYQAYRLSRGRPWLAGDGVDDHHFGGFCAAGQRDHHVAHDPHDAADWLGTGPQSPVTVATVGAGLQRGRH